MVRIRELINVLSDKQVQQRTRYSRLNQTCKICTKPADKFLSTASKFEFLVSNICQDCQTYYYGSSVKFPGR